MTLKRIQQLSPSVVTKIAAGEVIERPASVVKELLENSVDAGASRIDVEIEQGGLERICVVDDGHGIDADDLTLAFASHATSKLHDADDLFRVETLGFRGEALASIAGVAQVTLQSRVNTTPPFIGGEGGGGAELVSHGGQLAPVRPWNGAPGTRIDVKHLFFNTPVRRKFLKTPATELGHVCEVFTRLALSRPGLHLSLRHNGKKVYEVPGSASLRDRIGLFCGGEVRDSLFEIQADAGPAHLHGFVADPACDRGNARLQYFFLNGRWFRDRSLAHALQEAYRGLLMTHRYAVGFLFLEMPPDRVDVNVHPTKSEVRFRDAQAAFRLVLGGVRERLQAENLTAKLQAPAAVGLPAGRPAAEPWLLTPAPTPAATLPFSEPRPSAVALAEPEEDGSLTVDESCNGSDTVVEERPAPPAVSLSTPRVLQVYDTYLVYETPEGMLVVDQHALHERILFEQFQDRLCAGTLEKQRLLVPEPIELPAAQSALVLEHREALAELGLEVDDFGGNTLILNAYPAILGRRAPAAILRTIIDYLMSKERAPDRGRLLNDLISRMACRAAVMAGDRLTGEQIEALLAQRHLARDTHHCPHGRPTSLLFTRHDLERQFGRV